jgi:hypothetical protein
MFSSTLKQCNNLFLKYDLFSTGTNNLQHSFLRIVILTNQNQSTFLLPGLKKIQKMHMQPLNHLLHLNLHKEEKEDLDQDQETILIISAREDQDPEVTP